jgi:chemotaxis protein histidine kinase CheA
MGWDDIKGGFTNTFGGGANWGSFTENPFSPLKGKNAETPEASDEEKALQQEILRQLQDQQDWLEEMKPIQMKEMGYTKDDPALSEEDKTLKTEYETKNKRFEEIKAQMQSLEDNMTVDNAASVKKQMEALAKEAQTLTPFLSENKTKYDSFGIGGWREMTEDEYYASLNEREKAQYNLNKAQVERSTKALAGELELSEPLLDQKQKEFDELKQVYGIEGDTLETAQGTDTVSTQNLSDFKKRWAQVEEAQRFGQSSSAMEASIMSSGLTTSQTQSNIGTMAGIGTGNTTGGYGSLLQPYQFYNMAGYQANAQNAANKSATTASLIGAAAYLWSSKKFKKDIKAKTPKEEDEALKKIKKTKSYSYKYKPLMKMGDREHLGTLTEESPKEYVTLNGNAVDLGDKIEYLALGIKSLARKVDKIAAA